MFEISTSNLYTKVWFWHSELKLWPSRSSVCKTICWVTSDEAGIVYPLVVLNSWIIRHENIPKVLCPVRWNLNCLKQDLIDFSWNFIFVLRLYGHPVVLSKLHEDDQRLDDKGNRQNLKWMEVFIRTIFFFTNINNISDGVPYADLSISYKWLRNELLPFFLFNMSVSLKGGNKYVQLTVLSVSLLSWHWTIRNLYRHY